MLDHQISEPPGNIYNRNNRPALDALRIEGYDQIDAARLLHEIPNHQLEKIFTMFPGLRRLATMARIAPDMIRIQRDHKKNGQTIEDMQTVLEKLLQDRGFTDTELSIPDLLAVQRALPVWLADIGLKYLVPIALTAANAEQIVDQIFDKLGPSANELEIATLVAILAISIVVRTILTSGLMTEHKIGLRLFETAIYQILPEKKVNLGQISIDAAALIAIALGLLTDLIGRQLLVQGTIANLSTMLQEGDSLQRLLLQNCALGAQDIALIAILRRLSESPRGCDKFDLRTMLRKHRRPE